MAAETKAVAAPAPIAVTPIPIRELLPWLLFAGLMLLSVLYFASASIVGGETVHEFLHDGRHLLGFPCH